MSAWELYDGEQEEGPLEERDVLGRIADGLPATAMVRRVGEPEWRSLRTHAPFAAALKTAKKKVRAAAAAEAEEAPAPPKPKSVSKGAAALVVLAGVVFVAVAVKFSDIKPTSANAGPAATLLPAPAPEPATAPNPIDEIMKRETVAEAFAVASPLMVDKFNDSSPGGFLFALWSLKNLRWKDVHHADQTSFAKAMKDVDAERKKLLCVTGSIVEIAATKQPYGTLYVGLLANDALNLFHFLAVGSSGELVAESRARFCGFVTGRYDYTNSAGGTGHGIEVVGMFDLPANRAAK